MRHTKHHYGPSPLLGTWLCAKCAAMRKPMKITKQRRTPWERDNIQFPRLLAELAQAGLTSHQYRLLEDSMDLTTEDIDELLARAEQRWDDIKGRIMPKVNP